MKSTVEFGSLLTYTPRGNLRDHDESRTTMRNLKNDVVLDTKNLMSTTIAENIRKNLKDYPFRDYFGQDVTLVPIPKSSLRQNDELWVPQRIASAMANNGLGKNEDCLHRITPLPKSSQVVAQNRPKASMHYDSMSVDDLLFKPREIVLVDDVITRGATALGAASRLAEAFPDVKIRVFAVMRTISNSDEFSKIIDPRVGKINLRGEDTYRRP